MEKYGKLWPDHVSDSDIELYCYRYHESENPFMLEKHVHFQNAIKCLWPEQYADGEKGYIWSPWSYRRTKAWCDHDFQTWWGPSSSGKSTDAAICALTHWLAAPTKTTVIICSTSMTDLKRRIWREIVRFWSMLKSVDQSSPGEKREMPPTIYYDAPEGEIKNEINAIYGIPIPKGTAEDAVRSALGMHNDYNVLIVDELQLMHPCTVEAYDNLSTGKEAKFLGMGNPTSRLDALGGASEPKAGWNSISPENPEWPTKRGITLFFDGYDSPGVTDPIKYFFLLTQKQINQMLLDPGPDSPRFWTQRRGFVPPEGLTETVLTENFINKFNMDKQEIVWRLMPKTCAGLDPAFSSGGDSASYTRADYGFSSEGLTQVKLFENEHINLSLSAGEPMAYDLAYKVINKLIRDGITPSQLCIDITGSQSALADIIDVEWAKKVVDTPKLKSGHCVRVSFGGSASDLPFTMVDSTPCSDKFMNKVTELWMMFREYGMSNQIRGLQKEAAIQFCTRLILNSMKGGRVSVEAKKEMKNRTGGKSPDDADSDVCIIHYLRHIAGIIPGGSHTGGYDPAFEAMVNKMDLDSDMHAYQEEKYLDKMFDF